MTRTQVTALETVRELVRRVHNEHQIDVLPEYLADKYTEYDPRVGTDVRQFWRDTLETFPDLTVSLDRALVDHDQVMAFLTWRGNRASDGKELELHTSELFVLDGGKVTTHGAVVDYCELGEFDIAPQREEFPSSTALTGPHTDAELANVAVVLGAYRDVMTGHELEKAHDYYERDYQHHNDQMPAVAGGVEAFKEYFAGNFTRYPDLAVAPDHVLAHGDHVMVFATWRGTNTGFARGRRPTGKPLVMRTSDLFRLREGKVAEHWEVVDYAGLQRVGIPIRPQHNN